MKKQLACLLSTIGLSLFAITQAQAETARPATQCKQATQEEIASLFDRWNAALQTGNPDKVVERYAEHSILLPTVSGKARLTADEKKYYILHCSAKNSVGSIDQRQIKVGCNTAVDSGHYTFTVKDGDQSKDLKARYSYAYEWQGDDWYIISHHSSMVPGAH